MPKPGNTTGDSCSSCKHGINDGLSSARISRKSFLSALFFFVMVEIDFQRELLAPTEHLDRYMLHYKNNKYMYVHVLHNSCKGTYMYLRIYVHRRYTFVRRTNAKNITTYMYNSYAINY